MLQEWLTCRCNYLVAILLENHPTCIVIEEGLGVVQGECEHAQREHVSTRGEFHSIRIISVFGCKKIEICKGSLFVISL